MENADPPKHDAAFTLGRVHLLRFPAGADLLSSLADLCSEKRVRAALFSITGVLTCATIGVFDLKQRVYVTQKASDSLEIINCVGNVSYKKGAPYPYATAVMADPNGTMLCGRLFSPSLAYAAEMTLQELTGPPLIRDYDVTIGLDLWQPYSPPPSEPT